MPKPTACRRPERKQCGPPTGHGPFPSASPLANFGLGGYETRRMQNLSAKRHSKQRELPMQLRPAEVGRGQRPHIAVQAVLSGEDIECPRDLLRVRTSPAAPLIELRAVQLAAERLTDQRFDLFRPLG